MNKIIALLLCLICAICVGCERNPRATTYGGRPRAPGPARRSPPLARSPPAPLPSRRPVRAAIPTTPTAISARATAAPWPGPATTCPIASTRARPMRTFSTVPTASACGRSAIPQKRAAGSSTASAPSTRSCSAAQGSRRAIICSPRTA